MRKLNIKSKLVVITGSAGGLGKAFAVKLLSLGARVCISDINENLGRQTLSELSETFGEDRVEFVGCDVTKEDSVEKLIKQAEEVFKSKLYCFINNAGVMGEKEGWRLCMDINLTGVLHGTNLAMDQMGKDKGGNGGVVVNVASILGLFCAEQPKVTNLMSSIRSLFGFTSCCRLSVQCQQECSCHFDKVHRQRVLLFPHGCESDVSMSKRSTNTNSQWLH